MTFDLDIWRAGWFILAQSTEGLKVKVIGQSSRLQEESVAKVVGATWSEGFLVGRPFVQEAQLSLRDRATRACQLKSGKVLHKCRRLVFEKL